VPVFLRATRGAERDTHANLESILGHGNHRRRKGSWGSPQAVPKLHGTRRSAVEAIKAEADRHTAVLPIFREAQKAGVATLRQIAEALMLVASRRRAGDSGTRRQ
jgi:hypothetical protein